MQPSYPEWNLFRPPPQSAEVGEISYGFSSGGSLSFDHHRRIVYHQGDKSYWIHDAITGKELIQLEAKSPHAVYGGGRFSRSNKLAFQVTGHDQEMEVCDTTTGKRLASLPINVFWPIYLSADEKRIVWF